MTTHDIKVVLDNLYKQGKITENEKTRIGALSLEEALEIEVIKEEFPGINPDKIIDEKKIVHIYGDKGNTELDLMTELDLLKEISSSLKSISSSSDSIKGWVTFMGVLLIIQIVAALIVLT